MTFVIGHGPGTSRLAAVTDDLRHAPAELSGPVLERILAVVPAVGADPELREVTTRSVEANVAQLLVLMGDPTRTVGGAVPPQAQALGTALLRRGADPGALVHAYLVGQNEFWRVWMRELAARIPPGDELLAVLERSSERLSAWVDYVVDQLLAQWQRESEARSHGEHARRAELVRSLLSGTGPAVGEASRGLRYDLDRPLVAAVLWTREGLQDAGSGLQALETLAGVLAEAAGGVRPLTLPVGTATLWVWAAAAVPPDLTSVASVVAGRLLPGQHVALGAAAEGLAGFRSSHEEAGHARRVAELGERQGVTRYGEVAAVSLLSEDLDRCARFVRAELGALAESGEPSARLRETLLVWLQEGGNARRAAERLHTHKNTVLYRVARAAEILGRRPEEQRMELQLALVAAERLGPALATPTD